MWGQREFLKIINDKRQSKTTASKDQRSDCMRCTNSAGHLIDHMTFSITMSKLWGLQSAESISISVKGHWGYARTSPSIIHRFVSARHILKWLKMHCSSCNLPLHKLQYYQPLCSDYHFITQFCILLWFKIKQFRWKFG